MNNQNCLKFGIAQIVSPWFDPRLQLQLVGPIPKVTNQLILGRHLHNALRRLILSLSQFASCVDEFDRFLAAGGLQGSTPLQYYEIQDRANLAAIGIFHYLQVVADDVAKASAATLFPAEFDPKAGNGFGSLKKLIDNKKIALPLGLPPLFEELNRDPDSCNRFLNGVISFDFPRRHNSLRVQRHGVINEKTRYLQFERGSLA